MPLHPSGKPHVPCWWLPCTPCGPVPSLPAFSFPLTSPNSSLTPSPTTPTHRCLFIHEESPCPFLMASLWACSCSFPSPSLLPTHTQPLITGASSSMRYAPCPLLMASLYSPWTGLLLSLHLPSPRSHPTPTHRCLFIHEVCPMPLVDGFPILPMNRSAPFPPPPSSPLSPNPYSPVPLHPWGKPHVPCWWLPCTPSSPPTPPHPQ